MEQPKYSFSLPLPVYKCSQQFAREAFARMIGYEVEEVIGRNFRAFVAPEYVETAVHCYPKTTGSIRIELTG